VHESKIQKQAELDQKLVGKILDKLENERGEEMLVKRVQRDEKAQVTAMIQNKIQEEKAKALEDEKSKAHAQLLIDARRAWTRHRMRKLEETNNQRRQAIQDKIEEKKQKHQRQIQLKLEKLADKKTTPLPEPAEKDARVAISRKR